MKIAIYNLFLTAWVLFIIAVGSYYCYEAFLYYRFYCTGIIVAATVSFLFIATIIAAIWVLKLRIVIVTNDKITAWSFYQFKKTNIYFTDTYKLKWDNYKLRNSDITTFEIKGKDGSSISLSDFEFENFNKLASYVAIQTKHEIPYTFLAEQAKRKIWDSIFIFFGFAGLVTYFFFKGIKDFGFIQGTLIIICLLVAFTALRRWINYSSWERKRNPITKKRN